MTLPRLILVGAACAAGMAAAAAAAPLALPAAPRVALDPAPGARLPLDARFVDDDGRGLRLGELFGGAPVVLVPGYYTCPNLCSTLFEGVLQSLALSGLDGKAYRLVGVSIDPADTPATAAGRKAAYAAILPPGAGLHLLSGPPASTRALAAALGYRTERDPASGQLAHAAGFVVATPDGRVAQVLSGVRFDPAALRAAVTGARDGVEQPSLGTRLQMLCAHFAPVSGRHAGAAMAAVRIGGLLLPLLLVVWAWRRRGARA